MRRFRRHTSCTKLRRRRKCTAQPKSRLIRASLQLYYLDTLLITFAEQRQEQADKPSLASRPGSNAAKSSLVMSMLYARKILSPLLLVEIKPVVRIPTALLFFVRGIGFFSD